MFCISLIIIILAICFPGVASGNYLFLQKLSQNLQIPPDSLEELKIVLGTIAEIRGMSLKVELKYLDIWERYRTLAMYSIPVCECYALSHKTICVGAWGTNASHVNE